MKRKTLTIWETRAIAEHLRWYPGAETVRLNKRMTAVKLGGKWVMNDASKEKGLETEKERG